MRIRSYERELMDLGPQYYTQEEYHDCLKKIGRINALLGGDSAALKAFEQLASYPTSILDVGCGGGSFALKLAKKFPLARVVGIDISSDAIAHAHSYKNWYELKHNLKLPNLTFEHRTNEKLEEKAKSFDVVTATLVCHHLNDEQLVDFLKSAKNIARQAVILNDLHRHRLAYGLFFLIAPLFNNRLILCDGLLSIRRAFTFIELKNFLHKAGFSPNSSSIRWRWAFRWIVRADCR